MRQYNVKSYQELLESLKKASVENGAIINIESDITVADAIEIKEYNNLKITSQNGSTLIGGLTDCHWEQEGDFLTFKTEFEPRMLIINDSLRDKSSYPENGFLEYSNTSDLLWRGSRNGGWNRIPTTEELTHVSVSPKDLPENLDIDNCDIRVMHEWDESTVAIKDYDSTTGIITTKYPMGHPAGTFGKNQYQISNTRSGLKTPGTWCYDRKNKKIYYYPIVGETAQNIKSIIPVSNSVIKVKNCKNITIENLKIKFSNSRCGKIAGLRAINPDGAIQVEQSENINIDMTEISFSGGQGIKFLNSKNISVSNCIITKCAACGIATYDCENELISYNEITDIGILDFSAVAIHAGGKSLLVYVLDGNITEKGQTIVEYNSIDNVPYCGITCSGDSHIIRNNKISRCMMILGDGGAIYCSRGNKTLVHENYICDIPEKNAYGIYFDEFSKDCVIDGNVLINMKKPFNNHLSENLVVKNNIVINNNETEICMFCSKNFKWSNNLIYSAETITFSNDAVEGHELKQYLKTAQWNDDITFSQGLDKYIKFDNDVIFSVNGVILCRENNATVKVDCSQYGIINQNPRITMENDRIIIGITLNNIKNTYSVQKSKPYCIVTKIKPEKEEYYKKLHNEIWDQVVKQGHLFNIRNYSIFKYKNLYVSFFEYIGDDFEKDINKKNKLPIIKKWQKLCNECFEKTDIKPELIFFDRF